jgi:hypothetical protein
MSAPRLLPPRDLLQQIEGVESGLRRGRSARTTGLVVGGVQVAILVLNDDWFTALADAVSSSDAGAALDQWPLFLCVFLLALSALAVGWTRFWLRESRQPFRYTYSVTPFTPVEGEAVQDLFVPLHADLRERLSQRIRRLSLLEQDAATEPPVAEPGGVEAARAESHVHITGYYAIRQRPPDDRWLAEITAWVRVGGPDRPARLAEPVVRFALNEEEEAMAVDESGQPAARSLTPPDIDREQYEAILERTYFSIATELYRQIQEDVSRKIELLPNRWFRASALFYEAQDYARSNTLDAYNQARALYEAALAIYDPRSAILPKSRLRHALAWCALRIRLGFSWVRRGLSHWFPRVGRSEVLAGRAQIGYANTLLDSWIIAPLSGLRAAATYEAVPIAEWAVRRLKGVGKDVPGRDESLFDARVAAAFAHATLDARKEGRIRLIKAVGDDPLRAERDPRYLFVKALLEDRLRACIPLYQRAVELDSRFEAAQFQLAASAELVWRSRRKLEVSIASAIFDQYGSVLKLNPGSIAAWANTGYMQWLLKPSKHAEAERELAEPDRLELAKRRFEGGLRFKEIKQEAYVADLDHGLARIAAERGQFELAYRHYHRAVSAILSQGWAARSFADYHFDRISWAILRRFERYKDEVEQHHRYPSVAERSRTTPWLRNSVLSFVLYDYSEACFRYFLRTHDYVQLDNAYAACVRAIELNDQFVLAIYLRYQLEAARAEFVGTSPDAELLKQVEDLVPAWPEAAHKLLRWRDEQAQAAKLARLAAGKKAKALYERADRLIEQLNSSIEGTRYDESVSLQASVEEPARLIREASKLTEMAKAREEEEATHEAEARKLSQTLLPHTWLWDDQNRVAWKMVRSRAARRELRWERSLEPFHVSVLVAWCRFIADRPEGVGHVDDLLELIERRFLPNNLELIKFRSGRAGANGQASKHAYRAQIEEIVEGLLTSDESTFVALSELDPATPAACSAFAKVAALPDLSPYLYHWLGRQLLQYWKATGDEAAKQAAHVAYQGARKIKQPEALLVLADQVAELGDVDEREELYRKAADAPGGSLRELEHLVKFFDERNDFARVLHLLDEASSQDTASPERYASERGRALLLSGRFREARIELEKVPANGGALGRDWRFGLTQKVMERGGSTVFARLRDWLGAEQRTALAAESDSAAKDAALAALHLAHERRRGLWSPIADLETESRLRMPAEQPIVVEAHGDYFPEGGDTPAVRRLMADDIPDLRERIKEETGVFIPGFRLRVGPALPSRGYRILLDGAPVVAGTIAAESPDAYGELIARAGEAIGSRLASFVDLQSVSDLVKSHRIGDERRLCAFTSLLKRLVEADVQINDIDAIVRACDGKKLNAEEIPQLVDELRRTLPRRPPPPAPPMPGGPWHKLTGIGRRG